MPLRTRAFARAPADVLLCNGPGTCLPVIGAAALLDAALAAGAPLGLGGARARARTRVVYVESVARVRELSLTARIARAAGLLDGLLVQWPELARRYAGAAAYSGRLM